MALTTTEAETLAAEAPSEADAAAVHEGAPASGEQATETEQPAEGAVEETPAEEMEQQSTETAAKPGEEKKPEEKPAGWKAVELAKKEQLRLAKQRTAMETRERTVVEREQQFEQKVGELRAWHGQLQQQAARLETFERAINEGDLDVLEQRFGLSYESLTRRAVESRDPTGRLERLERERREERERNERERLTREQVEQTRHDAQQLVTIAEHYADEFPDLYTWTPDRIAMEGIALRDAEMRAGRQPTFDSVLGALQRRAKAEKDHEAQKRQSLEQRKRGTTSEAGSAGQAATKGTSGSPEQAPALTAKTSSIKATAPRPKTEEEIDEECRAELRRAFRK